jgi:hypothetical protein
MVKTAQPRPGAFPAPKKRDRTIQVPTPPGGKPWRPGRTARPEQTKSARLMMRMHPDLSEVLDLRAEEKGFSRAKLIEHILVGYLNSDPRNPRMSLIGKIDRDAPLPDVQRESNPHKFAERWQRFVTAHQALFGTAPPIDYADDIDRYWSPLTGDRTVEQDPEAAADTRATDWAAKKAAARKK